ncbi:hypothetical protein LDC_2287, partial [sediment metagenome]
MTAVNAANRSVADVNQAPSARVFLTITGSGPTDADGDGMADSWEIANFSSTNAANGSAQEDWDVDGMKNLAEYV